MPTSVPTANGAKEEREKWDTMRALLVTGAFIWLSGCAVGPNYKPPQTSVAGSFANAPTNAAPADEVKLATWWKSFNNPKLDGLVDRAVAHNLDLRIALANVRAVTNYFTAIALFQPAQHHGRVESTGICQHNLANVFFSHLGSFFLSLESGVSSPPPTLDSRLLDS